MARLSRRVTMLGLPIAGLIGARGGAAGAKGKRIHFTTGDASPFGSLRVTLWLPPDYGPDRRHPVLYMHDGQNLFDPALAVFGTTWAADASARRVVLATGCPSPLIVGIWSPGADRARTYLPEGAWDRLDRPIRRELRGFINGAERPRSAAYLDWIVNRLKPLVDRDYRTIADRPHSFIAGSSMGGLISLDALISYPETFGAVACLSTHWPIFLPPPGRIAPHRSTVIAAWTGYLGDRLGPPGGRRLWFDHGDRTLDALYAPYQSAVDMLLPGLGWKLNHDFVSRAYAGAAHDEASWAARLDDPMRFLLAAKGD